MPKRETRHLNEDTAKSDNPKDIRRDMRELIVPSKRKLEGDAKALHVSVHPACHSPVQETHLDGHNRYTSHKGAD